MSSICIYKCMSVYYSKYMHASVYCVYIYTHNVYTQLYHLCSSAALTGPRFSDTYI